MTFAVVAVVAVVAFAIVGGTGFAGGGKDHGGKSKHAALGQYQYGMGQYQYGMGQYQYGSRIAICHKGKTIKIALAGWKGHRRHHDTIGPCAVDVRKGKHAHHARGHDGKKPSVMAPARSSDDDGDDDRGKQGKGKGKGHSR